MGKGVNVVSKPHMISRMEDHELWMGFFNDPDDNVAAIMSEVPLASSLIKFFGYDPQERLRLSVERGFFSPQVSCLFQGRDGYES